MIDKPNFEPLKNSLQSHLLPVVKPVFGHTTDRLSIAEAKKKKKEKNIRYKQPVH